MKRLVHVLPRGEAVLPLLLIALLVLMFVAWPLAEIGVIERPLVGMLLVIVFLCALLTLGGSGPPGRARTGCTSADPGFQRAVEERLARELEERGLSAVYLSPEARASWLDTVEEAVWGHLRPAQLLLPG